jgi:death-on-curing protein
MTSTPEFLSVEDVLDLHAESLRLFGGQEGLRDYGGLVSATVAPQNHWHYSGGDHFDLAAVLLIHIGRNHPFLDGNERTALSAALVFLVLNGFALAVDVDAMESATLEAVQGKSETTKLAELFRQLSLAESD